MTFCRDVRTCHILFSPSQRAQDHRIVWIGRHLKRSLVQTSAQSRDRNEVGWGSSGLYSAQSWKPAVMQNCITSPGNLFQGLTVHTQRFFLIASLNFSSFNLCPLSLVLHLTPLWRAWLFRSLIKMLNRTVPHEFHWPWDWIWHIAMTFWAQPPDHFLPIWLFTHPDHDMHTVDSQYIFHGVQLIWVCWQ